jgi:urea carboxylase system permease
VQAVLPSIWDGFQIVGGPGADPSLTSPTGAQNAVVLGLILLAITTLVTIISVRLMAITTSVGVLIEIIGVVVVVVALFLLPERSPSVVFTTQGAAPTDSPYIWAWLASSLMAAYVLVGFDSAGELAEETHAPRKTIPKTIVRAVVVSGLGGALLIVATLVSAPSLTDGKLATGGIAWVLTERLGPVFGRLILVAVVVAVFACTLAVQTSGSRMLYSMARERSLPFWRTLAKVSPRTGTPIATSIVVGVGAALALAVNFGQSAIFTALSSLCIAMLYIAYLGVTAPLLITRLRKRGAEMPSGVDEAGKRTFSLGRWGVPLNIVAVVYQVGMIVNLAWPRPEIYDLTGTTWWLQWSAVLFIGATLVVGFIVHLRNRARDGAIQLGHLPVTAEVPIVADSAAPAGNVSGSLA